MQELWHFHVGLCKSRSEAICLVAVEDAEWMLIRRLLFLVMCQPSDKSSCRITCNLCHNHQSDANGWRIFVFSLWFVQILKWKMQLNYQPICPEDAYISSLCWDVADRLPYTARCNAHNSQYWFFSNTHVGKAFTFRCQSIRNELMLPVSIQRANLFSKGWKAGCSPMFFFFFFFK